MKIDINIWVVLIILAIHWFADFVAQTDKQAKGKSSNWRCLLQHTYIYSCCFCIFSLIYLCATENLFILLFAPITFVCHTITDYYTSRINSQLYRDGKIHEFFVAVGFDQLLHFIQLILTYQLLN